MGGGLAEALRLCEAQQLALMSHASALEAQLETAENGAAKGEWVRRTILSRVDSFTLGDVAAQDPSVSRQLVKKVLGDLKRSKEIRLTGRGRGARWKVSRKA